MRRFEFAILRSSRWLGFRGVQVTRGPVSLALSAAILVACAEQPPAFEDVDAEMEVLAERAIEEAREDFDLDLPLEESSIETVEAILGGYHLEHLEGTLDERERRIEAFRWGAFIGEVIRRHHGGHWEQDHAEVGELTFPLHYRGDQSFPVGWAYNRITNGPEDDVWTKYRYFVREETDLEGLEVIEHKAADEGR